MYKLQNFLFVVLNPPWSRNTPQDNTTSPITFDEMLELFNQIATYVGKKNYTKNFWDTEPYLKNLKPKYAKWQKVWKNRLDHYTPREKPAHEPIPIEGIIEKWDPKVAKGTPQFKTVKISPMFDKDAMRLYKAANEAYPAPAAVKNEETAECLRAVVGLDIRFMVGCDQVWDFSDDEDQAARAPAAGPAIAALPSAAAADDAPPPLLPRQWTQQISLSGTCSTCRPYPCLPKAMSRTTTRHGALRMPVSSSASCLRPWRPHFRLRLKLCMLASRNSMSIL